MKNLLFEVSSSFITVSYFESDLQSNKWILDISTKSDAQKKEVISDFLVREGITLLDYSNALVLWSNQSAVMVPSKLLEHTKSEAVMKLSFGNEVNTNEIDFNRIPLLSSAVIYTIPLWVKSLFVLKFTGSKIIHRMTSGINFLTTKNSVTKLHGLLTIEDGFISFQILQNDQTVVFIQNNFNAIEDIVYFVTYTLQKLNETDSSGKIELINISGKIDLTELVSKIKSLAIFPKISWEDNSTFQNEIIKICV
ncbi:MAG: DUF3822 family protein [Bacteroidota bacterium]